MAEPLVVASFNLRNGIAFDWCNSWPFRRAASAELLRGLDADVIGLQEAYGFQLRYLMGRLSEYAAVGDGRNGASRGEHTAVLTRGDVIRHTTRWFDVTGGRFPRIATTAVVEVHGHRVTFTSTHLDEASAGRRRESARQLIEWLSREEQGPHIVVGDFNATLDDEMFDSFAAFGLRSALPDDAGGTSHHFTGGADGRQIDHILVPTSAEVLDARVVTARPNRRLASDHWPVVASIRL